MKKSTYKRIIILTIIILIFPKISDSYAKAKGNISDYPATTEFTNVINNINLTNKKAENNLRIMSYNLLADCIGFEGTEAKTRADAVCYLFNILSPDVIGLQEVSRNWFSCIDENTSYAFIAPMRTRFLGTMTSIIYNTDTVTLKESGEKAFNHGYNSRLRRMVWGVFEHKQSDKTFAVINTHFSLSNTNITTPMNQATELLDFGKKLQKRHNCPVFFIGDFNAKERTASSNISSSVYEALCATLYDTKNTAQSISGGTTQSIYASSNDHIFLKGNAEVIKYVILSQNEFVNLSDHYPIFIDFCFK